MAEQKLDLTVPEAALMLTIIISLADDNPSEEETVVLRQYYKKDTAESLETKIKNSGLNYPNEINALEPEILKVLSAADPAFVKRTLAVCLKIAEADGVVDQNEMNLLNRYCDHFKLTMYEVELFGNLKLKELDETRGYEDLEDIKEDDIPAVVDLTLQEAGLALVTWVAFSDDDPSDEEMAVVREFYKKEDAEGLIGKMEAAGLPFPDAIPKIESSIISAFKKSVRDDRLKMLAVAHKTALADGESDDDEQAIILKFCEEFTIGSGELRRYS